MKLHADFQNFKIDELRVRHMCQALERPAAAYAYGRHQNRKHNAERLANLIEMFPSLTVIGAHFGG